MLKDVAEKYLVACVGVVRAKVLRIAGEDLSANMLTLWCAEDAWDGFKYRVCVL